MDITGKEPVEGSSGIKPHSVKHKTRSALPWVFIFALALGFQAQFVLLRKEFAAAKLQLSRLDKGGRSFAKRSLPENYKDGARQVSGVEAAHLRGTLPFQKIEKHGRIGPWTLSSSDDAFVVLKADDTEIEITANGLYYVYTQIYYFTDHPSNSYHVMTYNGRRKRKMHRVLSTCAGQGGSDIGEVSCHTGFTETFAKGQRLYLHQIEQNRIINNSDGCSFFGVVLLKKTGNAKRRKFSRKMESTTKK